MEFIYLIHLTTTLDFLITPLLFSFLFLDVHINQLLLIEVNYLIHSTTLYVDFPITTSVFSFIF